MRCLIKALAVVFSVLLILIGVAYWITSPEVRVERSITIKAPPETIFPKVNELKAWNTWSPWMLRDPAMKVSYEGPPKGVGAISRWESDTQGAGSQTIKESHPNESLMTELDFGDMGTATSDWTFTADGAETKVTWGMVSHNGNNLIYRIFGLFLDDMVGADYEEGLANLKREIEGTE